MTLQAPLRVQQTTSTTGLSDYTLDTLTSTQYRAFNAAFATGALVPYVATDNVSAFEFGLGILTTGTPDVLQRTTVVASSSGNGKVIWAAGNKNVFAAQMSSSEYAVAFTGVYAATVADWGNIAVLTGTAAGTYNLPALVNVPQGYTAGAFNGGTGSAVLTVSAAGADAVLGFSPMTLPLGAGVEFVASTAGWLATVSAFSAATLPGGQIFIGQSGGNPAPKSVSGDASLSTAGVLTVTKTQGVLFATSATTDTTNASNIGAGTLPVAQLPAFSGGDATTTAGSGHIVVSKIGGEPIALAGAFSTTGAYNVTLTSTAATNVTLPTSGTLLNNALSSGQIYVGQLGGAGAAAVGVSGDVSLSAAGAMTVGSIGGHPIALSATFAVNGGNLVTLTSTAATNVTLPTSGTLATTATFTTSAPGLVPTSPGGTTGFLRADGNWGAPAGIGIAYITANTTATAQTWYRCDTTAGGFNLTLPASPNAGDFVRVSDAFGSFARAPVIVLPSGNPINSVSSNMTCSAAGADFMLTWNATLATWTCS